VTRKKLLATVEHHSCPGSLYASSRPVDRRNRWSGHQGRRRAVGPSKSRREEYAPRGRCELCGGFRRKAAGTGADADDAPGNAKALTPAVRTRTAARKRSRSTLMINPCSAGLAQQPCHRCPPSSLPKFAREASDEFNVPLCRGHHRDRPLCGRTAWWSGKGVDPIVAARSFWLKNPLLPADFLSLAV
jgi:hypothetical protein